MRGHRSKPWRVIACDREGTVLFEARVRGPAPNAISRAQWMLRHVEGAMQAAVPPLQYEVEL